MNKDDKELLDTKFEGMAKLMNAHFHNVHDDQKSTKEHVMKLNGSIKDNQDKIHVLEIDAAVKAKTCQKTVEALQPVLPTINVLTKICKHPYKSMVIALGIVAGLQTFMLEAIFNQWFNKIWEIIKIIL